MPSTVRSAFSNNKVLDTASTENIPLIISAAVTAIDTSLPPLTSPDDGPLKRVERSHMREMAFECVLEFLLQNPRLVIVDSNSETS